MSKETARKSVDKFMQLLKKYNKPARPSIVFYGGEPLANWETMRYVLEYLGGGFGLLSFCKEGPSMDALEAG
jgi:sulfatase maturation enzyme AslB (radical SAM superfamily)